MRKTFCGLLGSAALFVIFGGATGGCGSDDPPPDPVFDGGSNPQPGNNTICLRVNCERDRDCQDCEANAKVCNQKEHRCIACGSAAGGKGCPQGQECTVYGDCVPPSTPQCSTDPQGEPTVSCKSDSDCGRCDPKHRACDTTTNKCVGCTESNRKMCQTTDACVGNKCVPQCPDGCATDSDCAKCGEGENAKHVCVSGQCGQCNDKSPCPSGKVCDLTVGACVSGCGKDNPLRAGTCGDDADCVNCENGAKKCKLPINGGTGECVVPVPACSGLGTIMTLPSPFDRVTQLCDSDAQCANVSADINIGKLLRQITGINGIKDGSIKYPMHACASVPIAGSGANELRCGACVPCKRDADCTPIDVLQVAAEIFGPLGGIAAAILLDQIFGPSDRKIHMYCSELGKELGYCAPCPNFLTRCGRDNETPDPNAKCDHDSCHEGTALKADASCNDGCAAEVCAEDPFCCSVRWDYSCIKKVPQLCKKVVCVADSCTGRDPGWYCSDIPNQEYGYYQCTNKGKQGAGQCGAGKCHRKTPGDLRTQAELDGNGKVKCY